MTEEIQKMCATCQKGKIQLEKDCPTRKDCFFPDYKNWEPIVEEDKENPGWSIGDFTYIKKGDILSVHLLNKAGGMIIVELSPDQIAAFVNNNL